MSKKLRPNPAPINTLPVELLTSIFRLTVEPPPYCTGDNYFLRHYTSFSYSKQPEWLALVCSRWRSAALNCPPLWYRIDLCADKFLLPRLLACAKLRVKRAGSCPLELYIDDRGVEHPFDSFIHDYRSLKHFLVRVARRMSAFLFVVYAGSAGLFHSWALELIIANCSPDHFRKLAFVDRGSFSPNDSQFIVPIDENHNDAKLELQLSSRLVENILSGVTVLHLEGAFLQWSSSAYRGLVDLNLTTPPVSGATYSILESNLISIFTESPRLRTFHFSLTLNNRTPDECTINPVHLQDLEIVQISSPDLYHRSSTFKAGSVLRLISPGSKPLQLILNTGFNEAEPRFESTHMKNFFTRSNVTKLYVKGGFIMIDQLLHHGYAPNLNTLVTSFCRFNFGTHLNITSSLSCWYLHTCSIKYIELQQMVELCPKGFILCGGWVVLRHGRGAGTMNKEEISAIYPSVRFLTVTNDAFIFPVN